MKIVREVTVDPYSEFIYASWAGTEKEIGEENGAQELRFSGTRYYPNTPRMI